MWVRQVDEQSCGDEEAPAFEVFFWAPLRASGAWSLDAWQMWDATAAQLRAWVKRNADGREVSVWAVARVNGQTEHTRVLVNTAHAPTISGDGTRSAWPTWAEQ